MWNGGRRSERGLLSWDVFGPSVSCGGKSAFMKSMIISTIEYVLIAIIDGLHY